MIPEILPQLLDRPGIGFDVVVVSDDVLLGR